MGGIESNPTVLVLSVEVGGVAEVGGVRKREVAGSGVAAYSGTGGARRQVRSGAHLQRPVRRGADVGRPVRQGRKNGPRPKEKEEKEKGKKRF